MQALKRSVSETLQELAIQGETGCLDVRRAPFAGTVYLNSGTVVHVDLHGRNDQAALLEILGWTNAVPSWSQGATPYRHTCHIPPDELELLLLGGGRGPAADHRNAPRARDNAIAIEAGVALPKLAHYGLVLQAQDPAHRPQEHPLSDRLRTVHIIGASPDSDVWIDHYSVCQRHAAILLEDDLIRLWDLGSHDATRVNGNLVDEAILQTGDLLQIGDIDFKVILRSRSVAAGPGSTLERHAAQPTPMPHRPLRFEDMLAERRLSGSAGSALSRIFDALRPDMTSKARGRRPSG